MNELGAQNARNCRQIGAVARRAFVILVVFATTAPTAFGQTIIDQYRPIAEGESGRGAETDGGGGSGLLAPQVPGGDLGPAATTAAPGGGLELPYTGYPLTPLLIALLILLLVGILLRMGLSLRGRIAGND